MKKYYFGLLLLFALSSYGQDVANNSNLAPIEKPTFQLYPNPAVNDVVYITSSINDKKDIVVYDVFGEVVLTDRISTKTLNISRLVAGVYVLQVIENGETMTRKLVVK
jgi:hypothetical protein